MKNSVRKWLLFGVLVALAPIGFRYISAVINQNPLAYFELISGGELFLISVALCASAVGDLIELNTDSEPIKTAAMVWSAAAVLNCIICSLLFAGLKDSPTADPQKLANFSILFYVVSLVVGASSVKVAGDGA